jgi:hypothetical protein
MMMTAASLVDYAIASQSAHGEKMNSDLSLSLSLSVSLSLSHSLRLLLLLMPSHLHFLCPMRRRSRLEGKKEGNRRLESKLYTRTAAAVLTFMLPAACCHAIWSAAGKYI